MKKWLVMMLVGVLFVGLGTGVALVEMSHYTFSEYTVAESPTKSAYVNLSAGYPVVLANDDHRYQVEVVVDPTLGDQARIEYPSYNGFFDFRLHNLGENYLSIDANDNPFRVLNTFFNGLQKDTVYIFNPSELGTIKLYVNKAYAESLSRPSFDHQEQVATDYRHQMDELSTHYEEKIKQQAQLYEQQLSDLALAKDQLAQQYELQIDNLTLEKDQLAQQYEQQLDNLRLELDKTQNR